MEPPDLHALLVGVGFYPPPHDPFARRIASLAGSVNDVRAMRRFLLDRLRASESRVRLLTSSTEDGTTASEPAEERPTLGNVLAAIDALDAGAGEDSEILVHFSGHGAQVPTLLPGQKGAWEYDEGLVLSDANASGGGLLRDSEIAVLLDRLAARRRRVLVVLDCCHSGGVMRENRSRPARGIVLDVRASAPRLPMSASLAARWQSRFGALPRRTFVPVRFGFALPPGAVVLAACRPWESAFEHALGPGGEPHGALTHFLLEVLREGGEGLTHQVAFDRVFARVHGRYPGQSPILEGDVHRLVFGREHLPSRPAVVVLSGEESATGAIVLGAGTAHGAAIGERFHIHAGEACDDGSPIAEVELAEVGATTSRAHLRWQRAPVASGARAIPLEGSPEDGRDEKGEAGPPKRRRPLRDLANRDERSPLKDRLLLTPYLEREDREGSRRLELPPSPENGLPMAVVGERIYFELENASRFDLNVVLFNLEPDGATRQVLPPPAAADTLPLRAGCKTGVTTLCELPPGRDEAVEVLKAIASRGASSFRWLEQDADNPLRGGHAGSEWGVAELVVRVVRRRPHRP